MASSRGACYNLFEMAQGRRGTTPLYPTRQHGPWSWFGNMLVLIVLGVSGCSPAPVQSRPPETNSWDRYQSADPSGQTIRFWHPFDKNREEALEAIAARFNNQNAWKIRVVLEAQDSYSQIERKLMGVLNTARAPELVLAYQDQAASYQLAGGLADLNPLLADDQWGLSVDEQNDFPAGFFQQDLYPIFGDVRLGLPAGRALDLLYYNADWLRELGYTHPPDTPGQFRNVACKASRTPFSNSRPGLNGELSVGYELSLDAAHFAAWVFAFGGRLYDEGASQYVFNEDAVVAALTFQQELFRSGCARWPVEPNAGQEDFGRGRLLFLVDSSASRAAIASEVETGARFEWEVAAVPHTTPRPALNASGPSLSVPRTTPDKELAAWMFIRYFTSPEVQAQWAEAANLLPVRAGAAAMLPATLAQNRGYRTALDLLPYSQVEPALPGYEAVREKMVEAMAAITAGGEAAPILSTLTAEANRILADQEAARLPTPIPGE